MKGNISKIVSDKGAASEQYIDATVGTALKNSKEAKEFAQQAQEACEAAESNVKSAEAKAQAALETVAEAKATAVSANEKIGNLDNVNEGYELCKNVVDYVNAVEDNLASTARYVGILDNSLQNKAAKTYVDDEITEVNAKIPTKVSALENDSNYVPKADMDAELAKKQDKELQWTLIYDETVVEERGSTASDDYGLNLDYERKRFLSKGNPNPTICIFPEYKNIVGLRIAIVIPENQSFGGNVLLTISSNSTWAQAYTLSALKVDTPRTKIINADWKIQHGVSESKCWIRTGVDSGTTSRLYCMDNGGNIKNGFFPTSYFKSIQYRHKFPVGAEIKVWGLIKE